MTDKAAGEAAQCALDDAVETYVRAMGWNGDAETGAQIITGWAMVIHQAGWNMDSSETSGYLLVFKGGTLPDHVARGLFGQGLDMVRGVGRYERSADDDEET